MPFEIEIPRTNDVALQLALDIGQVVLAVGANGSGKSAIIQRLYVTHMGSARRISAHRQTWLPSNSIMFSPEQKRSYDGIIRSTDAQPQSRWKDDHATHRAGLLVYNLIDAENARARGIAAAVDDGDVERAQLLAKKDAPIRVINELLRLSNVPITIFVQKNEQIVAQKRSGPPFSIAELSDGERNALLIAVDVLTAEAGSLLLIDEPERHLHRSIVCPLLTLLFKKRDDCAFFVSTHELMLPTVNPEARVLLFRGCTFTGTTVASWDVDEVAPQAELDELLVRDVLGSRRTILFVEGDERSLDKPLYALLFPQVSIVAKASCRDVEHAVAGIRGAQHLHWLRVWGLVDNDGRATADLDLLREKGIYATSGFSVESVYYHPEIQRRIAERVAKLTGGDPAARVAEATAAALETIEPHAHRLSRRVAEKAIREEFFRHLPGKGASADAAPVTVSVDVPRIILEEQARFEGLVAARDLAALVAAYPVRETPVLGVVAKKLGFQNHTQYEDAVRKLLIDDADALKFVQSLFPDLYDALFQTS